MSKNLRRLASEITTALDGRTQIWLSRQSGVAQPTISRIINAKHQKPDSNTVVAIAETLGVESNYFLDLAGHPVILSQPNRHRSIEYMARRLQEIGEIAPDILEYALDATGPVVDTFYEMAQKKVIV